MSSFDESTIDRMIDIARGRSEAVAVDRENRKLRRYDYDEPVAFVQMTPTGVKSIPTVVECKNISGRGVCVVSGYMLHVGHEGAILIERSNGAQVVIGVKVMHCKYVGDMKHESGLEFVAVPAFFSIEDFHDDNGRLPELRRRRAA